MTARPGPRTHTQNHSRTVSSWKSHLWTAPESPSPGDTPQGTEEQPCSKAVASAVILQGSWLLSAALPHVTAPTKQQWQWGNGEVMPECSLTTHTNP